MTSKKYRPWKPDQAYLFPPSMRDWLEEEHLVPMMKRVKSNAGRTPTVLTADTGYMSSGNATYCEGEGIDASSSSLRFSPVSRPRESAS